MRAPQERGGHVKPSAFQQYKEPVADYSDAAVRDYVNTDVLFTLLQSSGSVIHLSSKVLETLTREQLESAAEDVQKYIQEKDTEIKTLVGSQYNTVTQSKEEISRMCNTSSSISRRIKNIIALCGQVSELPTATMSMAGATPLQQRDCTSTGRAVPLQQHMHTCSYPNAAVTIDELQYRHRDEGPSQTMIHEMLASLASSAPYGHCCNGYRRNKGVDHAPDTYCGGGGGGVHSTASIDAQWDPTAERSMTHKQHAYTTALCVLTELLMSTNASSATTSIDPSTATTDASSSSSSVAIGNYEIGVEQHFAVLSSVKSFVDIRWSTQRSCVRTEFLSTFKQFLESWLIYNKCHYILHTLQNGSSEPLSCVRKLLRGVCGAQPLTFFRRLRASFTAVPLLIRDGALHSLSSAGISFNQAREALCVLMMDVDNGSVNVTADDNNSSSGDRRMSAVMSVLKLWFAARSELIARLVTQTETHIATVNSARREAATGKVCTVEKLCEDTATVAIVFEVTATVAESFFSKNVISSDNGTVPIHNGTAGTCAVPSSASTCASLNHINSSVVVGEIPSLSDELVKLITVKSDALLPAYPTHVTTSTTDHSTTTNLQSQHGTDYSKHKNSAVTGGITSGTDLILEHSPLFVVDPCPGSGVGHKRFSLLHMDYSTTASSTEDKAPTNSSKELQKQQHRPCTAAAAVVCDMTCVIEEFNDLLQETGTGNPYRQLCNRTLGELQLKVYRLFQKIVNEVIAPSWGAVPVHNIRFDNWYSICKLMSHKRYRYLRIPLCGNIKTVPTGHSTGNDTAAALSAERSAAPHLGVTGGCGAAVVVLPPAMDTLSTEVDSISPYRSTVHLLWRCYYVAWRHSIWTQLVYIDFLKESECSLWLEDFFGSVISAFDEIKMLSRFDNGSTDQYSAGTAGGAVATTTSEYPAVIDVAVHDAVIEDFSSLLCDSLSQQVQRTLDSTVPSSKRTGAPTGTQNEKDTTGTAGGHTTGTGSLPTAAVRELSDSVIRIGSSSNGTTTAATANGALRLLWSLASRLNVITLVLDNHSNDDNSCALICDVDTATRGPLQPTGHVRIQNSLFSDRRCMQSLKFCVDTSLDKVVTAWVALACRPAMKDCVDSLTSLLGSGRIDSTQQLHVLRPDLEWSHATFVYNSDDNCNPTGTAAGTATGTAAGTATGTAAGTATGTAAGT
eukprot:Lankesteria_metandrocarpae@DN3705_c0_g1_i2.p1